jgi:hypothetical protein
MWFGVSESVLQSAAVLPIQFQDIWSRSRSISAERSLALAVLQEALNDLVRYRFAARRRGQRLFWEAYAWIAANDRDWPYSFVNLCDSLGLPLEATRRQVLDAPAPVLAAVIKAETTVEAVLGRAA